MAMTELLKIVFGMCLIERRTTMSNELRNAVEMDQYELDDCFWDYKDDDLVGVSEAYMDYISTENYYAD